jgi:hypothetical protein
MIEIHKSRIIRPDGTVGRGFRVAAAIFACILSKTASAHDVHRREEETSANLFQNEPTWIVDHISNTAFADKNGQMVEGVRCGTPHPGSAILGDETISQLMLDSQVNLQGGAIRSVVHVICADDGSECAATKQMVVDQMKILNQDFAPYGFSFDHVDTVFTNKSSWLNVPIDSDIEVEMKSSLAVDPATTFNIYVSGTEENLLGWATFPQFYPEDNPMHGVVILGRSLPGGTAAPYNLGKTLVHEAGHYLGLYHTFEPHGGSSGCEGNGDYVDDTAAEDSPAFGCPIGRDTCRGEGPDPITNFMDYTDDYCMNLFSSGQSLRMMASVAAYKPSLIMPPPAPKVSGAQPYCFSS